jgi:CBS domain-containing protein
MKKKSAGRRTGEKLSVRERNSAARPRSASAPRVRDVMRPAYYCFENQPLDEARKIMRENKLAFLSVVDDEMRIVGKVDLA